MLMRAVPFENYRGGHKAAPKTSWKGMGSFGVFLYYLIASPKGGGVIKMFRGRSGNEIPNPLWFSNGTALTKGC